MNPQFSADSGSFRDRNGLIYYRGKSIYRQINNSAKEDYEHLMNSGLYTNLVNLGLLVSHEEVDSEPIFPKEAYKVIQPELIPFVSYPYEWCFSQLHDAALLTLRIEEIASEYGMTLKDASAYNIQFFNGRPVFIDTLSFEKYVEGDIWAGYRQFCQHFLAPLFLMHYRDVRYNQLLRVYVDGIPLDLVSKMLPIKSLLNFRALLHIHLHGRSQQKYSDVKVKIQPRKVSKAGRMGMLQNLKNAVKSCKWAPIGTEWVEYYSDTNYSERGFIHKKELVQEFLKEVNPSMVWDVGANTGVFSEIATKIGINTISFDIDPGCIERLYLRYRSGDAGSLPLIQDLTNPSPGIGWALSERKSLITRGPSDLVMALALIHHLTISNNVPFSLVAEFFAEICKYLIIEFVPKDDSQVQRLLCNRKDVFTDYSIEEFERAFCQFFTTARKESIQDSKRILYLMRKID